MGHATTFVPVEIAEKLYKQKLKIRTVQDLWNIDIDPAASKPIRPIADDYQSTWSVDKVNWDKAWAVYSCVRAKNSASSSWMPEFKNWFDRIRFNAHVKLIRWKVLI